jgi:hypothetical protein
MTTKNKTKFTATYILVSRKDHDEVLSSDPLFLRRLFAIYRRSWCLAGVRFYDLSTEDFAKLYKLLA